MGYLEKAAVLNVFFKTPRRNTTLW